MPAYGYWYKAEMGLLTAGLNGILVKPLYYMQDPFSITVVEFPAAARHLGNQPVVAGRFYQAEHEPVIGSIYLVGQVAVIKKRVVTKMEPFVVVVLVVP